MAASVWESGVAVASGRVSLSLGSDDSLRNDDSGADPRRELGELAYESAYKICGGAEYAGVPFSLSRRGLRAMGSGSLFLKIMR